MYGMQKLVLNWVRVCHPLCVSFVTAFAIAGCTRDSGVRELGPNAQSARIYTKSELGKLITPGMSIADVTNEIGIPQSTIQITGNSEMLVYNFPVNITSREKGWRMVGFSVHVRNGKVVGWSPATAGSRNALVSGAVQRDLGSRTLDIYVVKGQLKNVLNAFMSNGEATLSHLRISPDLEVQAKLTLDAGSAPRKSLTMIVQKKDVPRLEQLSKNNLGDHILIVYHHKVIAAPAFFEPVATSQLIVTVTNASAVERTLKD